MTFGGDYSGLYVFPTFVALAHNYLSYIECTRYSCNIMLIYIQVLWPETQFDHGFWMLHQAPPPPGWTNLSFIWLMCLLTVHAHRMGTWNNPIQPLLMEIWGGIVVGFLVVLELGTSDTQVASQKLCTKHTPIMVAAIARWPPWCPPPSTAAYNN